MSAPAILPSIIPDSRGGDAGGQGKADQGAWQREMERAEAVAWLSHSPIKSTPWMPMPASSENAKGNLATAKSTAQGTDFGEKFNRRSLFEGGRLPSAQPFALALMFSGKSVSSCNLFACTLTQVPSKEKLLAYLNDPHAKADVNSLLNGFNQLVKGLEDLMDKGKTVEVHQRDPKSQLSTNPEQANVVEINLANSTTTQEIRIYAELTGHGVQVWLGINPAKERLAAALVPSLIRFLREKGITLWRAVCNGRRLYVAPENMDDDQENSSISSVSGTKLKAEIMQAMHAQDGSLSQSSSEETLQRLRWTSYSHNKF